MRISSYPKRHSEKALAAPFLGSGLSLPAQARPSGATSTGVLNEDFKRAIRSIYGAFVEEDPPD